MDMGSIKDLTKLKDPSNWNKNDVMKALGMETSSSNAADSFLPMLGIFAAGLMTGIGAALLLAPTSGRKMREEIADRASNVRDRAKQTVGEHTPNS